MGRHSFFSANVHSHPLLSLHHPKFWKCPPSKHKMFRQFHLNVVPISATLGLYQSDTGSTSRVRWVVLDYHTPFLNTSSIMPMCSKYIYYRAIELFANLFQSDLYNVGPTSTTLGRRCINIIQMFCVCCLIEILSVFMSYEFIIIHWKIEFVLEFSRIRNIILRSILWVSLPCFNSRCAARICKQPYHMLTNKHRFYVVRDSAKH